MGVSADSMAGTMSATGSMPHNHHTAMSVADARFLTRATGRNKPGTHTRLGTNNDCPSGLISHLGLRQLAKNPIYVE